MVYLEFIFDNIILIILLRYNTILLSFNVCRSYKLFGAVSSIVVKYKSYARNLILCSSACDYYLNTWVLCELLKTDK